MTFRFKTPSDVASRGSAHGRRPPSASAASRFGGVPVATRTPSGQLRLKDPPVYNTAVAVASIGELQEAFEREGYLPGPGLAVAVHVTMRLGRPLLLEGEPGVGKTELARTLARIVGGPLIRIQCYEGIDISRALYEWDYARQMLYIRAIQTQELDPSSAVAEVYSRDFLVERPLLRAITLDGPRVLLIDELDRADDEFDAFLLEALDDYGVTIPELGRFTSDEPPIVIITSNRTRELHAAVKRRCLYHWIDFPEAEREAEIIRIRAPEVSYELARSVADTAAQLRRADLTKYPGAAEAIDWARALALLGADQARGEAALATLGWVVKSRDDEERARELLRSLADR